MTCKKGPCVSPNGGDDPGEGIVAPNLSLGFTPCFVLLFSEKEEKEEGKTLQKNCEKKLTKKRRWEEKIEKGKKMWEKNVKKN